ncbi:MAG TPA: FAD-dependent oxidoreductase, partial [Mycobacteriales bacterium]|nr:FAD-dependent oxidoreductase [Mycobacteriales bacterium]
IHARRVVVATGVWAGALSPRVELRPSKGAHLLVRATALGSPSAGLTTLVAGTTNRWVFAVPRPDGTCLVGLTDDPVEGEPPEVAAAEDGDEAFLLDCLNRSLRVPLVAADVVGSFAGLRPLLAAGDATTADLSRRHALVEDPETGVLTLVGGKLTTYRAMAEQAVDVVCRRLGVDRGCRTARLPLHGAAPRAELALLAAPGRLVARYGVEVRELLDFATGHPGLLEPVAPDVPALRVEFAWAVAREGALTVDDVLDRRTRLGLVPAWRAAAAGYAEEALAAFGPSVPLVGSAPWADPVSAPAAAAPAADPDVGSAAVSSSRRGRSR